MSEDKSKRAHVPTEQPYPTKLEKREEVIVKQRREQVRASFQEEADATPQGDKAKLGIALSGGGIRSATFALGLFQSLARAKLLRHIDYLSTVSGGGYFGSFFGALFARKDGSFREVEKVLTSKDHPSLRYLRENGNYLAPAGPGDLWLGGAVLLRNWVAVQVILLTLLMLGFLAAEAVLLAVLAWVSELPDPARTTLLGLESALLEHGIWLSPWFWVPISIVLLAALPIGLSYWTLEGRRSPRWLRWLGVGAPYIVLTVGGILILYLTKLHWLGIATLLLTYLGCIATAVAHVNSRFSYGIVAALTVLAWLLSEQVWAISDRDQPWTLLVPALLVTGLVLSPHDVPSRKERVPEATKPATPTRTEPDSSSKSATDELSHDSAARHRVSVALKVALVAAAGALAFAAIDTCGRSLYAALITPEEERWPVFFGVSGGVWAVLFSAATFARKIAVRFASNGAVPGASLGALAWVAAIVLVLSVLTSASLATQAITWGGDAPARLPPNGPPAALTTSTTLITPQNVDGARVDLVVEVPPPSAKAGADRPARPAELTDAEDDSFRQEDSASLRPPQLEDAIPTAWAALVALVLSLIFGTSRLFLNRSTHLPLYGARLTRAYLGASNPKRIHHEEHAKEGQPAPGAATRVIPGDDILASDYWGWPNDKRDAHPEDKGDVPPWVKGGPLHIVNVTINETVGGRSQIAERDRKGTGMAIGPRALSVGVRHHLLPGNAPARIGLLPKGRHRVFKLTKRPVRLSTDGRLTRHCKALLTGVQSNQPFPDERLSLGQWMGISGAAFSTGLGSRTHPALSLLAGFTNVRLGYWWRPGVDWRLTSRRFFGALFWVQTYLFRELLARFPGTRNALWYLSDGGHFENTGAYELIRRQLPLIVVVDAEEDADYQFHGLGNLVRKARLDFGAEIEFLPDPFAKLQEKEATSQAPAQGATEQTTPPQPLPLGPLEYLRRGTWKKDDSKGSERWLLEAPDRKGRSRACAALAQITYARCPSTADDATAVQGTTSRTDKTQPKKGLLLYIKPALLDDLPVDLAHYASKHEAFPHQSTGDQFFDEAQWESYRKLGELIGERLFCPDEAGTPTALAKKLMSTA